MRNMFFFIIGLVIFFGLFQLMQKGSEEEMLKQDLEQELEHQLKEGLDFSGSSDDQLKAPKNAPTFFSEEICSNGRTKCETIMQLKNNTPENVQLESDFQDAVAWCDYVNQECDERDF